MKKKIIIIITIILVVFLLGYLLFIHKINNKSNSVNNQTTTKALKKDKLILATEKDFEYRKYKINDGIHIKFDIVNSKLGNTINLVKIVNLIKEIDEYFNLNDYKIKYNLINKQEKYGTITFTYYMDKIETNKIYRVTISNNEVINVIIDGVKESNIKNLNNVVDKTKLATNIEKFNNQLKIALVNSLFPEDLKDKLLNKDMSINHSILPDNLKETNEMYLYDYNDEEIYYIIEIPQNNGNNKALSFRYPLSNNLN